ncbi:hypothetical protein F4811DRAFT_274197 [Daldinia bambusicola]|nr:hypothetical protein F4811DRAFT_274197 [Daldinia bambusicola]
MAEYTELELKTFELSSTECGSSLSVTSLALISDVPSSQHTPEKLFQSIQSKELWLVSPGICRMQIIVVQNQVSLLMKEAEPGFLEHLADAICRCPLWSALGLTIKQEDIQYEPLYDGAPNLYFIIEHLHKSSVLLSPPDSPTARLNGIECLFRYQANNSDVGNTDTREPSRCDFDMEDYASRPAVRHRMSDLTDDTPDNVVDDYYWEEPTLDSFVGHSIQQWDDAGYLAQVALYVTIGIRKRMRGLRLFHLDTRPSLLELAPAIWNAHYLKIVACHAKTIPIISTILATSSRHQSASLQEKSRKLLLENLSHDKGSNTMKIEAEPNTYLCSIQKKLWDLVQTTLEPTVRIKKAVIGVDTPRRENINWPLTVMPSDTSLEEVENGDYFYMIDRSADDDFNFENLYQHLGPLNEEYRNYFDVPVEYEQCYHENQDMIVLDEDALPGVINTIETDPSHSPGSSPRDALLIRSSSMLELRDASTVQQCLPDYYKNPIIDMNNLYTPGYTYDVADIYDDTDELPCNTGHVLWGMEQSMHKTEDDDPTMTDEGAIDHDNDISEKQEGSQDIEMY